MKLRKTLYQIIVGLAIALSCIPAYAASKATCIDFLLSQVRNATGNLAGGTVTVYEAGSTTPATIWLDRNKATTAANPYTLDANGTAQIYADGLIKIVLKNSAGTTVYTRDYLNYVDYATSGAYQAIGSDYASLNAAITALGATPTTLLIRSANFPMTSAAVIPATLQIRMEYPGSIAGSTYALTVNGGLEVGDNCTINTSGAIAINGPYSFPLTQVFTGTGAVSGLSEAQPELWGGFGTDATDDTAAFTAALASVKGTNKRGVVKLGIGKYYASQIEIPKGVSLEGVHVGGLGIETYGSYIQQVAGSNKDLIVFEEHTGGWVMGTAIRNLGLLGDSTATSGSGISTITSGATQLAVMDTTVFENLFIRGFKDDGIRLYGAVPAYINNIELLYNDGYGINFIPSTFYDGWLLSINNVSSDGNTDGMINLEDVPANCTVNISGLKSEKRSNASYLDVRGDDPVIRVKNCRGAVINISGAASGSSFVDGAAASGYEAPGPLVNIVAGTAGGAFNGFPIISWNGVNTRMRFGDSDYADAVIIKDEISGRTVPISETSGTYNGLASTLFSTTTDMALANGAGITYIHAAYNGTNLSSKIWYSTGDLVLAAPLFDNADVMIGQAYVSTGADRTTINYGSAAVRLENKSGSELAITDPSFRFVKIPTNLLTGMASELYDPPSLADGLQQINTIAMPGAVLGDFVVFANGVSLASQMATAYISATDTASVVMVNETGSPSDLAESYMWVYTLKDSAFRVIRSYTWNPDSLADNASDTIDIALPGARIGDIVVSSFSLDLAGIFATATVTANDVVTVVYTNNTGGVVDLGAGTLKIGIVDVDRN